MYCICCKKNNVIPIDVLKGINKTNDTTMDQPQDEVDMLWKKEEDKKGRAHNINNEMIDNGIIHIIDAGYGSNHDGDQFIIAICDDCIKETLEDATLLYYGNYMYSLEEFVEEEKQKSKQKYRRRKNLDGLV